MPGQAGGWSSEGFSTGTVICLTGSFADQNRKSSHESVEQCVGSIKWTATTCVIDVASRLPSWPLTEPGKVRAVAGRGRRDDEDDEA